MELNGCSNDARARALYSGSREHISRTLTLHFRWCNDGCDRRSARKSNCVNDILYRVGEATLPFGQEPRAKIAARIETWTSDSHRSSPIDTHRRSNPEHTPASLPISATSMPCAGIAASADISREDFIQCRWRRCEPALAKAAQNRKNFFQTFMCSAKYAEAKR